MRNILNKLKQIKLKNILWKIKITFFRTRKKLRSKFKIIKVKYPKVFNSNENRVFVISSFIMLLCIILTTSYAIFVYSTSSYRASDIRMANLTYSIKIDNATTSTKTIAANSTSTIELELNALNPISSKYLVYYTSANTLTNVDVEYSSMTTAFGSGKIGAEAFRIIRIVISNNSSSSVTLNFGVKGGYVYNNLSLSTGQYAIEGIYDETTGSSGDITMYTYLNGRKVSEMPSYSEMQSNGYIFDTVASSCTNGATITHTSTSSSSTVTVSTVTEPTTCNAIFHNKDDLTLSFIADGQYLAEAPPKDSYVYLSSSCNNSATITWNETDWEASVSNVTTSPTNCVAKFKPPSFADILKQNNPPTTYTTVPGQEISTTDEGLIEGPNDDYGEKTYYFRGTAPDNYVTFAGKTWRVVRINGDGSVRLILNTTTGTNSVWNTNYSATTWEEALSYATYGNSTIKQAVDNWYNTNIGNNTNYSSKVVQSKFCNDRTYTTSTNYYFGAWNRLYPTSSANPSYICPNSSHIYNLNVGLLTADEVAFAGGAYNTTNQSYYLYKYGTNWWTLSPNIWDVSHGYVYAWSVDFNGYLGSNRLNGPSGVVPVISLSSEVTVTTASETNPGTSSNPYIVQ